MTDALWAAAMRCRQCGFDSSPQAAFCSRCGARLDAPRPAAVREYSIALVRRSWWYYARALVLGAIAVLAGIFVFVKNPPFEPLGLALIAGGFIIWAVVPLVRRSVKWMITSDRLIEQRGVLATMRREVELQDIRSIEVSRSLLQRLCGLGDVLIASAASADYLIRIGDVYDPDGVAETVRKARLKRLA